MASEAADPIERWTAKRRVALVVSLLKGGDLRGRGSSEIWLDGSGGGGLAGEVSAGRRECTPHSTKGRRRGQGRADQEVEAEDLGIWSSITICSGARCQPSWLAPSHGSGATPKPRRASLAGAAAILDTAASDVWLSPVVGAVAIPRWHHGQ